MKKKVLSLGGGCEQVTLIQKLQAQGCEVFAVDREDSAPGKEIADHFFSGDTTNKEEIVKIIRTYGLHQLAVVSVERPLITAAEISEDLGLFFPLTSEQVRKSIDKSRMKSLMKESGVNTPAYKVSSSFIEFERNSRFFDHPAIVKPTDSSGSRGVSIFSGRENLSELWSQAVRYSQSAACIMETYVQGIEITVDVIVKERLPKIIMVSENRTAQLATNASIILSSCFPVYLDYSIAAQIELCVVKICQELKLINSLFFAQMVIARDSVFVLEFGVRNTGGSKMNFLKLAANFDIIDYYVSIILQKPLVQPVLTKSQNHICLIYLYARRITPETNVFLQTLKTQKLIFDYSIYKSNSQSTREILSRADRFGVVYLIGKNKKDLKGQVKKFYEELSKRSDFFTEIYT